MVTYNVTQGRNNLEKRPKDPSGSKGWEPLRMHPAFPGKKEPLDVNNHEHDHNPMTPHEHGTKLGTEHLSMNPVNETLYHIKGGKGQGQREYKGTTVTDKGGKKTYHG